MVGLHVTVELTGVIGDVDLYPRQAVVVVSRFAAVVHALSPHSPCLQYEPGGRPESSWTAVWRRAPRPRVEAVAAVILAVDWAQSRGGSVAPGAVPQGPAASGWPGPRAGFLAALTHP